MKKVIVAALLLVAIVLGISMTGYADCGMFFDKGFVLADNQIQTELSEKTGADITAISVDVYDPIYSRGSKFYVGEENKQLFTTSYPMYINDGSGIKLFDDSNVLFNSELSSEKGYEELVISEGRAINPGDIPFSLDEFVLIRLSNGLYINSGYMYVETKDNSYSIPSNSIISLKEDFVNYYQYENGTFTYHAIFDIDAQSIITIGSLEKTFGELLRGLGEVVDVTHIDPKPSEDEPVDPEKGSGDSKKDDGDSKSQESMSEDPTIEGEGQEKGGKGDSKTQEGTTGDPTTEAESQETYPSPDEPGKKTESERQQSTEKKPKKEGEKHNPSGQSDRPLPDSAIPKPPGPPEPAKQKPDSTGPIPNPDYVKPEVKPGLTFIPGVYSLKVSATVKDPAGAIKSGLVYNVTTYNTDGSKGTTKKYVFDGYTMNTDSIFLISGLKPDTKYSIKGEYTYKDEYGRTVNNSAVFMEEREFTTKSVADLGTVYLENWELDTAVYSYNSINIPNLKFTLASDVDAIASMTKIEARFLKKGDKPEDTIGVVIPSSSLNRIKSLQAISISSGTKLDPLSEYSIEIVCYDRYGNLLVVENNKGTSKTCLRLPEGKLKVENTDRLEQVFSIEINDYGNVGYTNPKVRIFDSIGNPVLINGADGFAITTSEAITINTLAAKKNYTAQLYIDCDIKDDEGMIPRVISTVKFTTDSLDRLGALIVDVENITDKYLADEISSAAIALGEPLTEEEIKLAVEKGKTDRAVFSLKINPRTKRALIDHLDIFTMTLQCGTEITPISFSTDELEQFTTYDAINNKYIDTVIIDTADYTRLQSKSTYRISYTAQEIYDIDNAEYGNIYVNASLSSFKTAIAKPELVVSNINALQSFLGCDIHVEDVDDFIKGESVVVKIYKKISERRETLIAAFRVPKNAPDNYSIVLTPDTSMSSDGQAYDIEGGSTYFIRVFAEEISGDAKSQYNYLLGEIEREAILSASGKIYSGGLVDIGNDKLEATILMKVNDPQNAIDNSIRSIAVDEYRNKGNAAPITIAEPVIVTSYAGLNQWANECWLGSDGEYYSADESGFTQLPIGYSRYDYIVLNTNATIPAEDLGLSDQSNVSCIIRYDAGDGIKITYASNRNVSGDFKLFSDPTNLSELNHLSTVKIYDYIINKNGVMTHLLPAKSAAGECGLCVQSRESNAAFFAFDNAVTGTKIAMERDVPEQYIEIEYLLTDGTQYIDTGLESTEVDRIVCDIQPSQVATDMHFMGTRSASSNNYRIFFAFNKSAFYHGWNSVNTSSAGDLSAIVNGRYSIDAYIGMTSQYLKINGETVSTGSTEMQTSHSRNYLFAWNGNGTITPQYNGRTYSVQLYYDGEILRDYVPVYNALTREYGFYDMKNPNVFIAASKGTLSGGTGIGQCKTFMEGLTFFRTIVDKDLDAKNNYQFDMHYDFVVGENADGSAKVVQVPLSTTKFSTEDEIGTIATGEEFIIKGTSNRKYIVVDNIELDNTDKSTYMMDILNAQIDFQGFSLDYKENHKAIINKISQTGVIKNAVLKSFAPLSRVSYSTNPTAVPNGTYGDVSQRQANTLAYVNYGTLTNIKIEMSQEQFSDQDGKYLMGQGTYWTDLSKADRDKYQSILNRGKEIEEYVAEYNEAYAILAAHRYPTFRSASIIQDNYGTVENFVVETKSVIAASSFVGTIATDNQGGGTIQNGYVYGSYHDSDENHTAELLLLNNASITSVHASNSAGGVCAFITGKNAVIQNIYTIVDVKTYKADFDKLGGIVGRNDGSGARITNCYVVGDLTLNSKNKPAYGPAIGYNNGGTNTNIYYYSENSYKNSSNTFNIEISLNSIRNATWQNNLLNSTPANKRFNVDTAIQVNCYPQISYTSNCMPAQTLLSLPETRLSASTWDIVYAFTYENDPSNALNDTLLPHVQGNLAWVEDSTSQYLSSDEQVLCVMIADVSERIVYSISVEDFDLSHEDILAQVNDGNGVTTLYVRMHNPSECKTNYLIEGIQFMKSNGQADVFLSTIGSRYAYIEYFRRIDSANDGKNGWVDFKQRQKDLKKTSAIENIYLNNIIDFTGVTLGAISWYDITFGGKFDGNNKSLKNIEFDPMIGDEIFGTGTDPKGNMNVGLFGTITGEVYDVVFDNCMIEAGDNVGMLAAYSNGATITNVLVKNSSVGGGRYVGGLVGYTYLTNIYASGVINTKVVNFCSGDSSNGNYQDVTGETVFCTGGLVGMTNDLTDIDRSFTQNIYIESQGADACGGLVGFVNWNLNNVNIRNCYSTGEIISMDDYAGGFIGLNMSVPTITGCYSDVDIYAYGSMAGGFFGGNASGSYTEKIMSFGNVSSEQSYAPGDEHLTKFSTQLVVGKTNGNVSAAVFNDALIDINGVKTQSDFKQGASVVFTLDDYKNNSTIFRFLATEFFEKAEGSGYLPRLIAEDGETALKAQIKEFISLEAATMELNELSPNYVNVGVGSGFSNVKVYTDFTFAEENIGSLNYGKGQNTFSQYQALQVEEGIWSRDGKNGIDLSIKNKVHYYDTYWLTGIRYKLNGEDGFLRVGKNLNIASEYKTINSRNDWETIVVGSHGENFKLASDIDFSNHTLYPNSGMCSMIINRLVGANSEVADGIAKISEFTLGETTNTYQNPNYWQTNNGAGFIKIILSELSNISFDDIAINRPYSMHNAIIGKVQGPVSNVSFTNCTFNSRCAGSCIYDLRDRVLNVTLSDIDAKSTNLHMGGWLATVYDPLWYNSQIIGITADKLTQYDNSTSDACSGGLIEYGRNLLFSSHSAPTPRTASEVCSISKINVSNCKITGTTIDTALVIAGPSYITFNDISVKDSSISRTVSTGNTGESGIIVAYGANTKLTIQNSRVDNCTLSIPSSSNGGGIAGLFTNSTINKCTVSNSKIKGLNNIGGVIGSGSGTTVSNSTVDNCTITAGGSYAGGISGINTVCTTSKVSNSTITATSNYASGIYGGSNHTTEIKELQVIDCTIKAGGSNAAGIGGDTNRTSDGGPIIDCYVSGCHIEGNDYVGGLIHTGSQPRRGNTIENSEIIGKGSYVGGAIGAVVANNATVSNSFINSENGAFSAWVKNCNIYGLSSVGGATGTTTQTTIQRYGFIVQNCDVRGLAYVGGVTGGSDNAVSNSSCGYVENTYIGELDETTALKSGIIINDTPKQYFGGVFGYAAYSDSDMVYNSIVNAPNANYVGAIGGRVAAANSNAYGLISKDSVVVGNKYVGGLFGTIRPEFKDSYAIEKTDTHRAVVRDSYSNALVYGTDMVGGISGAYETESGSAKVGNVTGTYYMAGAIVKSMYFTGALNATGAGSNASAVFAYINVKPSNIAGDERNMVEVQNVAILPDYIRVGTETSPGKISANYCKKEDNGVKDSFYAVSLMDTTVLLTDGKDGTNMVSTDAAVRATYASVATPGSISMGGNYSVLTCAGLKSSMLDAVGGRFVWKNRPSKDIPKDYVEVEYLQNSNENQKLVIPVTGKAKQYFGIRGRLNQIDYPAGGKPIFASNTGSQFYASTYSYTASTNRIVNSSTFGTQSTNGGWTTEMGVPSNFTLDTLHIETDITKKELVRPITQNFSSLTFFNTSQIIKLYKLEIISGTMLEHSLVPVKRLSDNAYGMYDVIGNHFYDNQGTGTFTGGNEIQWSAMNDLLAPLTSLVFYNDTLALYNPNGNNINEFKTIIKQGVFLPSTDTNVETFYAVLHKQHLMYQSSLIDSEKLRSHNIGIIGLDSVKNITEAMGYINIFADNTECDKIRIEVDKAILDQDYGNEKFSQKIKYVYLSLIPDRLSANSSDSLIRQKLDVGIANTKIKYNYVDIYDCTLSFAIEERSLSDPDQIITREIIKNFVLTPNDLRNPLVLNDIQGYELNNATLFKDGVLFATGIVNVAGHNILLDDGTVIDLDEPDIESHITIPKDYVEVEYLQNSNENQKLVIPVTGKAKQYFGIRGRLNQIDYPAGGKPIFASNTGSQFYASTYSYTASTNRIVNGSTFGTQSTYGGWTTEMGVPSNFILDTLHVETDLSQKALVRPITKDFSSLTFFNTSQIIKLYKLEIISGTMLEHSLVPVKRLSDNAYGMYDVIENKFYGNNGSGVFTGGPVVEE